MRDPRKVRLSAPAYPAYRQAGAGREPKMDQGRQASRLSGMEHASVRLSRIVDSRRGVYGF
jgi:hypothetical protein